MLGVLYTLYVQAKDEEEQEVSSIYIFVRWFIGAE